MIVQIYEVKQKQAELTVKVSFIDVMEKLNSITTRLSTIENEGYEPTPLPIVFTAAVAALWYLIRF